MALHFILIIIELAYPNKLQRPGIQRFASFQAVAAAEVVVESPCAKIGLDLDNRRQGYRSLQPRRRRHNV